VRELVADRADLFVGHRHRPSIVRRTHPVDFCDLFTAAGSVVPPWFGFILEGSRHPLVVVVGVVAAAAAVAAETRL